MARSSSPVQRTSSYRGVLNRMQGRALRDVDNDVAAALARISETPDGDLLLKWIHQQTLGRVLPDDLSDGALRADAARRSFATQIFNMLDRGLNRNAAPKRPGK